jgi:hypothetical protein
MNNVVAGIFIFCFLVLVVVFHSIGGAFDKQFWLGFLPGLMGNLAILAVAIFVIEDIFKRERSGKLAQANASQSKFVLLLSNRLAYHVLAHLELASIDEINKDPELNFEFATERLRGTDLAATFYEKLMASENRASFAQDFAKIVSTGTETISEALDKIYPRPAPALKQATENMMYSSGAVGVLKTLFEAFGVANKKVAEADRMAPEQLALITDIALTQTGGQMRSIQTGILELSANAKANRLFISLD